jgi:hypothetical protein
MIGRQFFAALATLSLSGCIYGALCEEFPDNCAAQGAAGSGAGGSGAAGAGGDGGTGAQGGTGGMPNGGGGSGGAPPLDCELVPGQAVGPQCGVFVRSGASGMGTQADPMGDVQAAITAAAANGSDSNAVYICGDDNFPATLTIPGSVRIYGRLACSGWTHDDAATRPTLTTAANAIPITIASGEDATVLLSNVSIVAANATMPGRSSIGVVVGEGAALELVNSSVTSGNGAEGAVGTPFLMPAPPGEAGDPGMAGCDGSNMGNPGGDGGLAPSCTTGGAMPSAGGPGGGGTASNSGGNGTPGESGGGAFGTGQTLMPAAACDNGDPGPPGMPGTPAARNDYGTLTNTGYSHATPAAGTPGDGGKGGGGGGGGFACVTMTSAGPGGGGGGSGGCGGAGGPNGQDGGASFAVVLLEGATLARTTSDLTSGNGGAGGNGAAGQPGGNGSLGGQPGALGAPNPQLSTACAGGAGAKGGDGGPGAGGNGGLSAPIAATAAAAVLPSGSGMLTPGTAGMGGMGSGAAPAGAVLACPSAVLLVGGAATCL